MSVVRLSTLHPTWIDGTTYDLAKGIEFDCPPCLAAMREHKPPYIPGHRVEVWFIENGKRAQWGRSGTDFDNLSISPSIDGTGPDSACKFHGFVSCGNVTW